MLVIANGAAKSGSTWLFNIINEMSEFERPPSEYLLDQGNVNPEVKYNELADLLENIDYSSKNYLIKNHFGNPEHRDLILPHSEIYVIDILRDARDVVVSAYFHNLRESTFSGSFKKYYWQAGRWVADHVRSHHEIWKSSKNSNIYLSSYDRLKDNFKDEVLNISKFLQIDVSDQEIDRIAEATSMNKLREKYSDNGSIKFFRKGVSGDWKNHFNRQMMRDVQKIETAGIDGTSFLEKNTALVIKKFYDACDVILSVVYASKGKLSSVFGNKYN